MKELNEIDGLSLFIDNGLGDKFKNGGLVKDGDLFNIIITIRRIPEGWLELVTFQFVANSKTREVSSHMLYRNIYDNDELVEQINKEVFNGLNSSYKTDNQEDEKNGFWRVFCNCERLSEGYNTTNVEKFNRLKELLNFEQIIKDVKCEVFDGIENYDSKIQYALDNNIFELGDDLSEDEKISYIESIIQYTLTFTLTL